MREIEGLEGKRGAVLRSAFDAFRLYGYRRTSMEDIAKGAEMSRAAVYLHFRNKEDVFSHLVRYYFDRACAAFEQALDGPGDTPDVLAAAFRAKGGEIMEVLLTSPHGDELMEAKTSAAEAIANEGGARMIGALAGWLAEQQVKGRVQLEAAPEQAAGVMIAALWGMKESATDFAGYEASVTLLGQMLGRAIAV